MPSDYAILAGVAVVLLGGCAFLYSQAKAYRARRRREHWLANNREAFKSTNEEFERRGLVLGPDEQVSGALTDADQDPSSRAERGR